MRVHCFRSSKSPKFTDKLRDTLAFLRAFEIIKKKHPTSGDVMRFYQLSSSSSLRRVHGLIERGLVKRPPFRHYGVIVTDEGVRILRKGEYHG